MKALIFGANGQDGTYLDALIRSQGVESVGVSRGGDWRRADVASYPDVVALVAEQQPDYVFHLAAASTTRHSALFENHASIATGALNVLEAVKTHRPAAKVFITGSGLQFVNTGAPISERDPFEASSPYALARIHSVYAARYYRTLGIKAYVGYLFHHDSPRRPENHVSQLIASAVRRIAAGSDETLEINDVTVQKEWAFADDIVAGIWQLVNQNEVSEATIGTGEAHSIEEWLDACFSLAGKNWRDHVRVRADGQGDYGRLVSDPTTIHSLGWVPQVSFTDLARMMLDAKSESMGSDSA